MTSELEIERLQASVASAEMEADEFRVLCEHLFEKIAKLESYQAELEAELAFADATVEGVIESLKRMLGK